MSKTGRLLGVLLRRAAKKSACRLRDGAHRRFAMRKKRKKAGGGVASPALVMKGCL